MTRGGHCFTPAKTREAEAALVLAINPQLGDKFKPLSGPLRITLMFGMGKPKSNKSDYCVSKPDLDNLSKTFLDAMNGILYHDDSQVVEIVASKFWALQPGTECWIEQISQEN